MTTATYDFFLELRPPGASDLNPSAYLHARGTTQEEAIASLRNVPATWSVYVKRQRLIESRTCHTCGSEEEMRNRSKTEFGWVAYLECTHVQNDDEY